MITQNVSKEERDNGELGAILGNCKVFWRDGLDQPSASAGSPPPPVMDDDDSIPF